MALLIDLGKCLYFTTVLILMISEGKSESEPTGMNHCMNNVEQKSQVFETDCMPCDVTVHTQCPAGTQKLTTGEGTVGCTDIYYPLWKNGTYPGDGCKHTCQKTISIYSCCKGHWGPMCNECPGGANTPCNGHGVCDDSINGTGTCSCEAGWSGSVCEFCINTNNASANCSEVPDLHLCSNVSCPNNSKCNVIDKEPVCMCNWPFVNKEDNVNNGTAEKCLKVDFCSIPPFCDANATCTPAHNPEKLDMAKNCTCNEGYYGDGYQCEISDPCQTDYGGCDKASTQCVYISPGQSKCVCLIGYQEYVPKLGCSLIDVCQLNSSLCHPRAICKTVQPNLPECTCKEGYRGDGHVCYGNILQTIKDINELNPDLKGQLNLIQTALSKYYFEEITKHGPFTVFIPTNEGFRSTNTANFQKWLQNGMKVRQVLRQHIVVGTLKMDELLNQTVFHTLQGTPAELLVNNRGDIFKFRLHGANRKGRIMLGDEVASNGIVHIINKLMLNSPDNIGHEEMSVYQQIETDGRYNRLQTLLSAAGSEMMDLLTSDNVTMFVPNNAAVDALPAGSFDYLQSPEGKGKLISILKHHIFKGKIEIAELINMPRMSSLSNVAVELSVTETGQVQLNQHINITQADIVASNGLLFDIDGVLVPSGVSTLPSRCDKFEIKEIKGPCRDCREEARCFVPDVLTNTTIDCQYYAQNAQFRYVKQTGCAPICNRTYTMRQCCDGFYGFDCLPCPGGYKNPCNGHGKCADGYYKEGMCQCDENFSGVGCERCAKDNYFGPNCTQECTCVKGVCDGGPNGNGRCASRFRCHPGYYGSDCDKQNMLCSNRNCHAHALCIFNEKDDNFRCLCKAGYEGDGAKCRETDPCTQPTRGGCHLQASCKKTGPGLSNCTCNDDWSGDGTYCYPATSCRNHSDCHQNADCFETAPGKHICLCRDGYHGNGISCVLTDMCTKSNGGCHEKAVCLADGPGRVNCTCKLDEGYSGSGYSCYGNLVKTIEDHPNLTVISGILKRMDRYDLELLLDDNYTIFVPTDQAIYDFATTPGKLHWVKTESKITLLNYHTLMNTSSLDKLVAMSEFKKLETMADGFYLYINRGKDNVVRLMPRHSGTQPATVLESDIIATNGYLNVIDKVLEPYTPVSHDKLPDLETFFSQHPEYSIFGKWLKERNLTDKLENMNEYTLFVPNNDAVKNINRTVTTDFLRFYIIPHSYMMADVDDGVSMITDLGVDHQLLFNVFSWENITVNQVFIDKHDMFTFGGLVNGITGLLHPVLNVCNETVKVMEYGPCTECGPLYKCSEGYIPFKSKSSKSGISQTQKCEYYLGSWHAYKTKKSGCQGLCVIDKVISGCCDAHFGPGCQECLGGPELPCNRHGMCNDGINGTGKCVCQNKFTGPACNSCVAGWTGPNCDIDMSGCGYKNGGCHSDAICDRSNSGKIKCKCGPGYRGDGYNCTGPCDINNGNCHKDAICSYEVSAEIMCVCRQGMVGDGKTACNADIYTTLSLRTDTTLFSKSITGLVNDGDLSILKNATPGVRYTLFVPVDTGLRNVVLDKKSVLQHIVVSNASFLLSGVNFDGYNATPMSGDPLYITFDAKQNMFYVNKRKVLEGNIQCTNGIIHLLATPLALPVSTESPLSSSNIPVGVIVGVVVTVVVIAAAVVLGVFVYRRSNMGYWKLLQNWRPTRKNSEGSSQAEPLHFNDSEDDPGRSGLPAGNTNFGNPMYRDEDSNC